ncbi:MAG TPA: peptidylprolyl isomerase, partial [Pirellulales bacterium]|nr:peptidylprolyl isomerase [Pirellulales bacterium]
MLWRVFKQFRPFDHVRRNRRTSKASRVRAAARLSGERLERRCYLTAAATPGDPIVTVDTNFGNFRLELFPADAPQTVTNFLSYVTSGKYNDTVVSRSIPNFVVQTGGITSASATYTSNSQFVPVPQSATIPLEYKLPNTLGTIAMARGSAANSATDEWFINTADNSTNLGPGGVSTDGYAVFGKVLGNGMTVVNTINALSTKNEGSVQDSATSSTDLSNLPLGANNELVRITSMTLDSIDGEVFTDTNGNGTLDSGEPGVAGRTVFIDSNNSGNPGGTNPTTTTDANGNYTFAGLAAGQYTVKELLPSGVTLTTGTHTVTVTSTGTVSGVNFGEAVPA